MTDSEASQRRIINFSGVSITPEEIVDFLKHEMLLKDLCQKLVSQKIIAQAAKDRGVTVTPEEIQAEANDIRYEKRLEKASDALAWLTEQMITTDDWETGIRTRLLAQKLAEHLFDKEVEKFFAQNQLDFEQFVLYQIVVPYEQLAWEIYYRVEEEEISFYEAAHLYDIDEQRRNYCGYEGKLYRWSLKPDIAAVVMSKPVGNIIGPLKTDRGYHLLMVTEFIPAELNSASRQEIIDKLFEEWLESELNYLLNR
ncbi:MAG: peptidylprolyl isomerase [Hydrococcus sp. C42_A2020_068]|nr:peptidylprolyl isomerase [Hydrococcus sp. C42_A2020_068]